MPTSQNVTDTVQNVTYFLPSVDENQLALRLSIQPGLPQKQGLDAENINIASTHVLDVAYHY